MFISDKWTDYEILDAGGGEKLERWGKVKLLRPEPQAVWPRQSNTPHDARYIRSSKGGGHWEFTKEIEQSWVMRYGDIKFSVRPTGFKHTGLFPEQAANWDWCREKLKRAPGAKALNLFAYTGGLTTAMLKQKARVVHVDAARSINAWAKENVALNGLEGADIRYICDDVQKFCERELRRNNTYDAIAMDPPSYGRGPSGEVWKLEQGLYDLVMSAVRLLSERPLFLLVNCYTAGLAPTVLNNVLKLALRGKKVRITTGELCLPVRGGLLLPCGISARAEFLN